MRILVVCQHYWPEPFNTSDICEELVKRGHSVTVLTALPNTGLPGNDIPVEYKRNRVTRELLRGVQVIRVPLHPRKSGPVNRVMNYLTFWRNANNVADKLTETFDVVLGYQFSPIMQVDPGLRYAAKHGKKMLQYSFDLWPASLLAGGFSENSLPFKWMKSVSKRIYAHADRIAVTSPLFDEYFRDDLGLDIPDSIYLPQYADDSFLYGSVVSVEGYDSRNINLTFAGNVGQAQSVITIVESAALIEDERVVIHIVGSGSRLEQCQLRANELGLKNIVFHGRHPVEEMPSYYAASDAMLVTFENSPMAQYTLPRKVTTYLAAGKPVIAALSGETKRVLDEAKCGLCCETANPKALAGIIQEFLERDDKERMSIAAKEYYLKHFIKEKFYATLELELKKLVKEN